MDYNAAFQISASGMAIEKTRLEVVATNLANMHSAGRTANQVYRPGNVVAQAVPLNFSRQFGLLAGGGVRVASIVPDAQPPRMAYEPGHPFANAQGMVAYPAVDHTQQMLVLNTALRAYEANIVAMNAAKTMASRTLEIGGQG